MDAAQLLSALPVGLRQPLIDEYKTIIQNYSEHRWLPSALSGGRFCEIVFTIIDGYGSGTYASTPAKPANFVMACRNLENRSSVPRSFQILIPRLLPTLYEVRNNRGVGHVGGDVDPNHMDATLVVSMCSWVMAELVRVLHVVPTEQAQRAVDLLAERPTPLIWHSGAIKLVLDPSLKLREQILLLLSSSGSPIDPEVLRGWIDYDNKTYFRRALEELYQKRLLYKDKQTGAVQILPPGQQFVSEFLSRRNSS